MPEPGGRDAQLFVALQRGDPEDVGVLIAEGADVSRSPSVAGSRQIAIRGGSVSVERDGKEVLEQKASTWVLDLEANRWILKMSDD